MPKILAISGGIDSVVMLHTMRKEPDIIVAHFNHGTRPDSDLDQDFVQRLACQHQKKFESAKISLGEDCSEAQARHHRYAFLTSIAKKHHGEIYTAHHQDDLLESIVINLLRGTGWRGLVPLDHPEIHRPLLNMSKKDIYRYAAQHSLAFRQDSTNTSDIYLRNRIRQSISDLDPVIRKKILTLSQNQKGLKTEISQILIPLLAPDHIYQRDWFRQIDDQVALELLRATLAHAHLSATRPQLADFLQAIRTYTPGKRFNLGRDRLITIRRDDFVLQ